MMSTNDAVSSDAPVDVDRADQREIRKMAAAGVRIVEQEQLAGTRLEFADRRHGVGQCTKVHGDVRGLRDHLALGIEQRCGGVAAFADIRRQRAVDEYEPHLLRDRCERVRHDLETDGVEFHVRSRITAPDACTVPRHPGSMSPVASGPARTAGALS